MKRYYLDNSDEQSFMDEDPEGEWVRFEDLPAPLDDGGLDPERITDGFTEEDQRRTVARHRRAIVIGEDGGYERIDVPPELRALSDAATPGPWEADVDFHAVMPPGGVGVDGHVVSPAPPEIALVNPTGRSREDQDADLALIVAAVNYVRRALAETLRNRG